MAVKGSKSKTMKGKEDYTTKKGSKHYVQHGHEMRPYRQGKGVTDIAKVGKAAWDHLSPAQKNIIKDYAATQVKKGLLVATPLAVAGARKVIKKIRGKGTKKHK